MTVTISRWGNSLGLRIPKEAAAQSQLHEGDRVEITSRNGEIVITKSARRSLEELLSQITPETLHGETFSRIIGNEAW